MWYYVDFVCVQYVEEMLWMGDVGYCVYVLVFEVCQWVCVVIGQWLCIVDVQGYWLLVEVIGLCRGFFIGLVEIDYVEIVFVGVVYWFV